MADQLSALDASFLEIEEQDDASHMHVGWAMVFDRLPGAGGESTAPSAQDVMDQVEVRLNALPRFRERLSRPHSGGLSRPSWEPDERFDVANHVKLAALPSPGGEKELMEWLGDFWSHRLDRALPLWELALVSGLADGRWALVTKTHHSLVDGMSGVDVTNLLLDATPDAQWPPENGEAKGEDAAESSPGQPWWALRAARAGAGVLTHPRRSAGDILRGGRAVLDLIVHEELVGAPPTSLNVSISGTRRFAVARSDLNEMKAVKGALGGTFNDVVLAAVTGALRAFLQQRGDELPDRALRAMVPVSLRSSGEEGTLGNRVSSLFVDLPVATSDPAARYAEVMAAAEELKAGSQAVGSDLLVRTSGLVPPAVHALALRTMFSPRLFNLTITNIPGPPRTLYAFGAPMREVLPLVPVFAQHAVGIAVVSYAGGVYFGLNADSVSVRDLDVLSRAIEESIAELVATAGKARPRPSPVR
ncbi:MAG TPA: wax ester/triacylglycerol synthase family O-acyltransferase [Thermoleophilaceae bacterium]|jgi:WS/DGAT/MGAT family acyltransferase